jgi:hypothetical protein
MIIRWCMGVNANGSWFKGGRSGVQDQKSITDETDIMHVPATAESGHRMRRRKLEDLIPGRAYT